MSAKEYNRNRPLKPKPRRIYGDWRDVREEREVLVPCSCFTKAPSKVPVALPE